MSFAGIPRRLALAGALLLLGALQPAAVEAAKPPLPELQLREPLRGEDAIRALGPLLPAVAAHYGLSSSRLAEILREDPNAWIDVRGRLLFIDAFPPAPEHSGTTDGASASAAGAPDLEQTFLLHSKPGSQRVIYLDFNGHIASNTAWSSGVINAPPYDFDGVPLTFGNAEKERIQYIWQRIAEDYAPFDVDVTTEEPPIDDIHRTSSADQRYGTRVVITHSSVGICGGCGGVAYVGVFDYYSSSNPGYYQPAWVFYDALGNGHEKYVAEAASHEAGHNLGLFHDGRSSPSEAYYQGHGSGATGWAPIMGVGYYRSLVQWSKGEYPNANNREDDFVVIAANGAKLRADDWGSTLAQASRLQVNTPGDGSVAVDQPGVTERASDVDVFSFEAGAGDASFWLTLGARSPNLDAELSLYDGAGELIAAANDPTGLGASLSVTLTGGSYYLRVDGVGDIEPTPGYSDYGSVGVYRIGGSYVAGSGAQPPLAQASATPTSGIVPLAVAFSGAASNDSDGSIVAWEWDFGDGAGAATMDASHTYTAPGIYTATLIVTDDQGLQDLDTVEITVTPDPRTTTLHVEDITIGVQETRLLNLVTLSYQCSARVTIHNGFGEPTEGVSVSGSWSGAASGSGSAVTDGSGVASIAGPSTVSRGTCTFTVTGVGAAGYSYDPAANVESSDSLTY